MSKVVLVMDMAECCLLCQCSSIEYGRLKKCQILEEELTETDIYDEKPEWCPLKPLPKKMQVCGRNPQQDGITPSYKIGFNACIDAILSDNEV